MCCCINQELRGLLWPWKCPQWTTSILSLRRSSADRNFHYHRFVPPSGHGSTRSQCGRSTVIHTLIGGHLLHIRSATQTFPDCLCNNKKYPTKVLITTVPFAVVPCEFTRWSQRSWHDLKQSWKAFCLRVISTALDTSWIYRVRSPLLQKHFRLGEEEEVAERVGGVWGD